MINILILSAGTRDKVVQYFKEALAGKGKVIATDGAVRCDPDRKYVWRYSFG